MGGRLALVADSEGSYVTKTACSREGVPGDVLVEVFRDGTLLVDQSFDDVRARAHSRPLDAAAARERRRGASEQIVLRGRVNPNFDPGGVCASFLPNTSTPK